MTIRTESIETRRTALVASRGPEAGPAVRELWYVLHGYGQRAASFLAGFDAVDDGTRLLVAPEALSRYYDGPLSAGAHRQAPVVASWMTRAERESEIRDYVRYLDEVHATMTARLGGARPPVTVLGYSQGGATAVRWTALGRVRPARLVVWASSLPPDLDYAAPDSPLRDAELIYVGGTADQFITSKVLEQELARLSNDGLAVRLVRFEGGHRLDDGTLRQIAEGTA